VRADGLYRNVTEFYGDWDSIFDAAAGRFEGGWTAEIEIPYKSISFDPTTDTWGLNFTPTVVRKNEVSAWVPPNRAYNPAVSGLAIGFQGLQQGIGLEVVPSLAVSDRKSFVTGETDSETKPSLDMAYRITPQLNGSLTINTDFSVTEVDDRQVNLTRLGLFIRRRRIRTLPGRHRLRSLPYLLFALLAPRLLIRRCARLDRLRPFRRGPLNLLQQPHRRPIPRRFLERLTMPGPEEQTDAVH
jgi:hypothetical protein